MENEVRNRKHTKNSTTKSNKKNVKHITSKDNTHNENVTQYNIKNNVWSDRGSNTEDCDTGVFQKRDEGDGESTSDLVEEAVRIDALKCNCSQRKRFQMNIEIDGLATFLFLAAVVTRFYKLDEPRNIVFDELHYGKYVSLYMKRTFYFDPHPPFGKQLIAVAAYLAGFDGQCKFDRIGNAYPSSVPLFALRLVPALCGSLIVPAAYYFMLELNCKQWTAALASFLILCDNALLTQSRFILMESMLLLLALFGLLCVLRFRKLRDEPYSTQWWLWLALASVSLTLALCVKYVGFFSCCLGLAIVWADYWKLLGNHKLSDATLILQAVARSFVLIVVPVIVYLSVFYVHLSVLNKAGPHDSIMTSAFQASLEGGLASITRGQPLEISHGSQITLRHTFGRACWLHSHAHVYPLRYQDKRGSSHQQQVTCYTFKDVNNWWIVKRPDKNNLVVSQPVDAIKHGDIIQLVHGLSSRALNSHDVAAPMSPHNQEVSCYIDYNVSMPAQNLWRVEIINREQGDIWYTIQSRIRLIHVNSSQALKFSGRQLPDWGFYQHEVVTDRVIQQEDTVWNVEEHRYTKSEDEKEREREMMNAEMIPLHATSLSFWEKFSELQYKMLFTHQENVQNHMYSSEPLEWPLMTRGIAYWVSTYDNGQVYLLGNVVIWYTGAACIFLYCILWTVYLLRRHRQCYDLSPDVWSHFIEIGEVLFAGFLFHYLPYFFVERTLFLHHYLPAFMFKVLLTAAFIEHVYYMLSGIRRVASAVYSITVLGWSLAVLYIFRKFCVLSYGLTPLSAGEVMKLRWKESWDFIIHKQ